MDVARGRIALPGCQGLQDIGGGEMRTYKDIPCKPSYTVTLEGWDWYRVLAILDGCDPISEIGRKILGDRIFDQIDEQAKGEMDRILLEKALTNGVLIRVFEEAIKKCKELSLK